METEICYRCQMHLPYRLLQFVIGPRGGIDALCYACEPGDTDEGKVKKAEIVQIRKNHYAASI